MKKTSLLYGFLFLFFLSFSQPSMDGLIKVGSDQKKFIKQYFAAEVYKISEDYTQAIIEYESCISILPKEPSPYYQIGKIELYIYRNLDEAEYYLKQAINLDPKNEWFYYDLLAVYVFQNNFEEQIGVYKDLIDIKPKNVSYYYELIRLLSKIEKYKEALKFIKKTEKDFGASNDLLIMQKDIYISQGDFNRAKKICEKLVSISPKNYNILAELYMHFSDYENAIKSYKELLKEEPQNPEAIVALYQIYVNKKDIKNQEVFLLKMAKSLDINIETKKEVFYNILINDNFQDFTSFMSIIKELIKIHPEEPLFNLIIGDLYAKEQLFQKSLKHYKATLNTGVVKDDYVYTKMIEIYWQQKDFLNVSRVSLEALERFPIKPRFYYYKALADSQNKNHEESIQTLLKGKDFIFDNDMLLSDFFSLMGDAYHDLKQHDLSDESYTKALHYNSTNTTVLNNFSYYLSIRGEKLDLAKKMILECLDLTKTEPSASYIDTYAWVLYKMGDFKMAKEQIERALKINQESPVLIDHYGDILYKLGYVREAIEQWKISYQIDNTNKKVEQKINQKKLNE